MKTKIKLLFVLMIFITTFNKSALASVSTIDQYIADSLRQNKSAIAALRTGVNVTRERDEKILKRSLELRVHLAGAIERLKQKTSVTDGYIYWSDVKAILGALQSIEAYETSVSPNSSINIVSDAIWEKFVIDEINLQDRPQTDIVSQRYANEPGYVGRWYSSNQNFVSGVFVYADKARQDIDINIIDFDKESLHSTYVNDDQYRYSYGSTSNSILSVFIDASNQKANFSDEIFSFFRVPQTINLNVFRASPVFGGCREIEREKDNFISNQRFNETKDPNSVVDRSIGSFREMFFDTKWDNSEEAFQFLNFCQKLKSSDIYNRIVIVDQFGNQIYSESVDTFFINPTNVFDDITMLANVWPYSEK